MLPLMDFFIITIPKKESLRERFPKCDKQTESNEGKFPSVDESLLQERRLFQFKYTTQLNHK